MAREQVWFTLPQAVVLLATRDLDLCLQVTGSDSDLLVVKANRLLGMRGFVPLDPEAGGEEEREALRKLREEKLAGKHESRYLTTQKQLPDLLARGISVRGSRNPGGPLKRIDSTEFTRLELRGLDAIDKRTGEAIFYNLRIHAFEFVEKLRQPAEQPGTRSADQPPGANERPSLKDRMSACTGDRLPLVMEWVLLKYRDKKLPGREQMLKDFRKDFGPLLGVNEKTMREVRRSLVTGKERLGGAPTHRR